jgi:NADPH:quinone reductase-like Zn-dependent oxidoreductase
VRNALLPVLDTSSPFLRVFAGNFQSGTFQQYCVVEAEITSHIPANVSFDEASTLPSGIGTAFLGLYAPPSETRGAGAGLVPFYEPGGLNKYAGRPIIIIGGATSMGQFGKHGARRYRLHLSIFMPSRYQLYNLRSSLASRQSSRRLRSTTKSTSFP